MTFFFAEQPHNFDKGAFESKKARGERGPKKAQFFW